MKKIFRVVILVLAAGLIGCATVPPIKLVGDGVLPKTEVISIKKIALYKDTKVVGEGENKDVEFFNERSDDFSKAVVNAFEERFKEKLEKSKIKISPPNEASAVSIEVKIVYRIIPTGPLSEVRGLTARIFIFFPLQSKIGESDSKTALSSVLRSDIMSVGIPLFLPSLTIFRPEGSAKRSAEMIAERFADVLAERLK